jgi:hypothetical protein
MIQITHQNVPGSPRAEIVELIRRIQSGEGGSKELEAFERVTGNPNVWVFFDVLELKGMSPDKIFDLLCGDNALSTL